MGRPQDFQPWPLDFLLLELLPDKGTIGGIHWKGRRVKDMTVELNERLDGASLDANGVSSRLRSMQSFGIVESFPGKQGDRIWARLGPARTLLTRKEAYLG